jgi:glucose-6-phosphate isomerase
MKTITMDLTCALTEAVGANGIDAGELATTLANISDYYARLLAKPFAFMTLPETKFQFDEMWTLADKAAVMDIKNLVILGIGGSSLGTQTIFEALLILCTTWRSVFATANRATLSSTTSTPQDGGHRGNDHP